ncbi:cell division protein FtsQ/DivIB [Lentibacillus saliphilus]|uniref:cell division protein FtsQ/DivIB n=1 Tax=Lentibacillus saliphilus TaxID=2737028 RepID=UPI001C30E4AA|nr:FtsQ-type POTRA domain-containing protein [Lentibacillus saliphilus]
MSKKNIVSIEDRIPKLKQARKKKANRRLITYLTIFFLLVSVVVYLQTPLSHIKTIHVRGHNQVAQSSIIQLSGLSTDMNIWSVDLTDVENTITDKPEIRSVKVERELPWTINIQIDEFDRVGYVHQDKSYIPLLETGELLSKEKLKQPHGDAPLLIGFRDSDVRYNMSQQLKELPASIRHLISEIHWTPEPDNKNKLRLYMIDGFVVEGTIRNFSDRMKVYPSIVSQLAPGSKGIVHIGVGAYFEAYDQELKDELEE